MRIEEEVEAAQIREAKKTLRREILAKRDAIPPQERAACDRRIKERLFRLDCYRKAEIVLAYASYKSEADTRGLMERALADGKQVFAPRVAGREMEFWRIEDLRDLRSGYRGIPEPVGTLSYPAYLEAHSGGYERVSVLLWIPGAAFDRDCRRIGYGGGFYDRYLEKLHVAGENAGGGTVRISSVALAYDCQVLERIPWERHDYRPDYVLTPSGLIRRS